MEARWHYHQDSTSLRRQHVSRRLLQHARRADETPGMVSRPRTAATRCGLLRCLQEHGRASYSGDSGRSDSRESSSLPPVLMMASCREGPVICRGSTGLANWVPLLTSSGFTLNCCVAEQPNAAPINSNRSEADLRRSILALMVKRDSQN